MTLHHSCNAALSSNVGRNSLKSHDCTGTRFLSYPGLFNKALTSNHVKSVFVTNLFHIGYIHDYAALRAHVIKSFPFKRIQ